MSDTSADVDQLYREMIMSRTPAERLRMASGMFDAARRLAIAGIKDKMPALTDAQLRAQLFLRLYGDDFSASEIEKIIKNMPDMQLDK